MNEGKRETGGSPFPQVKSEIVSIKRDHDHKGITIWDYFALHALTGLAAANPDAEASWFAARAGEIADAMIKERP